MRVRPYRSSRITATRLFTAVAAVALAAALLGGALAPRGDAAATISARLVKDIYPGSGSICPGIGGGCPDRLTAFNGKLYFSASDGTHGNELWRSDGTAAGTVMVKAINDPSAVGSTPSGFTAFNGSLYFAADNDAHGFELWKTDGTDAGTVMVAEINPGGNSSNPSNLTVAGDSLYFKATDGSHGYELWKSDGTVDTLDDDHTFMVQNIDKGSGDSLGANVDLTAFNGYVYFAADDGDKGTELWRSDGSTEHTEGVADIFPGTGDSNPYNLTVFNGSLYLAADGGDGTQLYKTDGTPSFGDTLPVIGVINPTGDSNPGGDAGDPQGLTAFNGNLYFQATDGGGSSRYGTELWKTDGTSGGTNMLKDINPTSDASGNSDPYDLTVFNGGLYFGAFDGFPPLHHATELWKSDGTSSGTNMLKDINTSGTVGGNGNPVEFTALNGSLYFEASDGSGAGDHGTELWKTDGSSAGTVLVADISAGSGSSSTQYLTAVGNNLLFNADDGTHGAELWEAGDYSPPVTQIDSGPSGTITVNSASFAFSADEASTFQCALDGAAMSTCSSPKAFTGLANGSHTFQVRATDLVGNVDATPASRSFTVNVASPPPAKTAPQTTITKHPKKVVFTKSTTAKVSFAFKSSRAGSHFSCKLDKGKWSSCRSPKSYKVKLGKHTFHVRATSGGKTDPTPAKLTWTVKRK